MRRFYDEQIQKLQQALYSGITSLMDAASRRSRGMPVESEPDLRGAIHATMDEMAEDIAWKIEGAWIEALLANRIAYADCDRVRLCARENVEDLLDGREMRWRKPPR